MTIASEPAWLITLPTLEHWQLPAIFSGALGRNRADGRSQIMAKDDQSAVMAWLARYTSSPATLASYRREAERLLMWCVFQHRRALSDLTHEDLLTYQRFLSNPQPAQRWVLAGGHKPPRASPQWRPFAGPLSLASQRLAMSVLNAMFSWLVEAGYLAGNPLALSRKVRRTSLAPQITRYLPLAHWQEVLTTIECMPASRPREALRAARVRWMFSLLYIGALRVSELTDGRMSGFFLRMDRSGQERWWLEVTGKGRKQRLIPVTQELLSELVRYRGHCGLAPLPSPTEEIPLVLPLIGATTKQALKRSAVHQIVKSVVRTTAERLRARGPEWHAAAQHIEQASTHWLRHTAGSHLSENADLKVVRDNLGHANISTTSLYLHTDDDARHDATEQAHHLGWRSS